MRDNPSGAVCFLSVIGVHVSTRFNGDYLDFCVLCTLPTPECLMGARTGAVGMAVVSGAGGGLAVLQKYKLQ